MNSKDFVKNILEGLHKKFPSFTFKYQFDSLDDSHVIQYSPFDLIEGDLEFENSKYEIINDYFDSGFDESIVFIDEFDSVGISLPEYSYIGHFNYCPNQNSPEIVDNNVTYNNIIEVLYAGENNFALAA